VDDERQRAVREFGALSVIQSAGVDIAPQPVLLDESKTILPYPIVIYQWAKGTPLRNPITHKQLASFLSSYHLLHNIQPDTESHFMDPQISNLPTAWFHWFNFYTYLEEISELFKLYTPWLADDLPNGTKLKRRLAHLINVLSQVITDTRVYPSKENVPLRLVRVDPNTANAIWETDGIVRWVDWEYSGWGDPALDIAELRWHEALQPLGDIALQWLRTNYKPSFDDPEFNKRLCVWDHVLAVRWPFLVLRLLWSNHNGPDRERLSSADIPSAQLYQRLMVTIQKAERFFTGDG
jgi:hypothetical protein